jgi:adenine deaminase
VENGLVRLNPGQDVAKICIIERHGKMGEHKTGFVVGLGFDGPAALATTVAHDNHNLMVMGNSEEMMARAARAVADEGRGCGSHAG